MASVASVLTVGSKNPSWHLINSCKTKLPIWKENKSDVYLKAHKCFSACLNSRNKNFVEHKST